MYVYRDHYCEKFGVEKAVNRENDVKKMMEETFKQVESQKGNKLTVVFFSELYLPTIYGTYIMTVFIQELCLLHLLNHFRDSETVWHKCSVT